MDGRRRLFYVCGDNLAAQRGWTIHISEIVKNLSRQGYQIILFAPNLGRFSGNLPVKIVYLPYPRFLRLGYLIYNLALLIALIYYGLIFPPRAIYTRLLTFSVVPPLLAWFFGCPHLVEVNGIQPEEMLRVEQRSVGTAGLAHLFSWLNMIASARIIVTTEEYQRGIEKFFRLSGGKIRTVSCGVNPDLFHPLPEKELSVLRESLGLTVANPVIGFVGTLYPWRGLDYLIAAAEKFVIHHPEGRFLLVGGGEYQLYWERMVRDKGLTTHFRFTGEVPYPRVPLYINLFRIAVSFFKPVRSVSGDPQKIYEYLSCAKAVVASRNERTVWLLEKNNCGITVDAGSVTALNNAWEFLLTHQEEARLMGERGRKLVVEQFSWAAQAGRTLRIIEEVAG